MLRMPDTLDPAGAASLLCEGLQRIRPYATFGRLDVAFNNAGVISDYAELLDTTDAEFERVLSINVRGVWNWMHAELSHMLKQAGAIVTASSPPRAWIHRTGPAE